MVPYETRLDALSSMERVYYQELSDMLDWDESELPLLSDLTNDG